MSRYKSLKIFDYSVFISSLEELDVKSKCVINTLNQYSFMVAENDHFFKESLLESDVLIPDGIGIVAAARLLQGIKIKKIAGSDIHSHLLKKTEASGGKVFYLGSDENTLTVIQNRLAIEYRSLKMAFYSPPFTSEFSKSDSAVMVKAINTFRPDILFVGMTAPKQEKWVYEHKDELNAVVICSIGAVFDFYAETVKRPGQIWIDLGLEWFIRLLQEPRHTWKRYLYYGPGFVFTILKRKLTQRDID